MVRIGCQIGSLSPEMPKRLYLPQSKVPPVEWGHPVFKHLDGRRKIVRRCAQIDGEEVTRADCTVSAARKRRGQKVFGIGPKDVVDSSKDHLLRQVYEAIPAEQQISFSKRIIANVDLHECSIRAPVPLAS
jgi:hypothetical protein